VLLLFIALLTYTQSLENENTNLDLVIDAQEKDRNKMANTEIVTINK
jgi:hypothetical protein